MTAPHYATFNIERIKTFDDLFYRYQHNTRQHIPKNLKNPERMGDNIHSNSFAYKDIGERLIAIDKERKKSGVARSRKNITPAVEVVLGASRDWFKNKSRDEVMEWVRVNIEWATEHYKDRGKLISYDVHFCETAPHIHLIFIPEVRKLDKRTGKTVPALDADSFMGKRKDFYNTRDSHAEANKRFGLERGINYRDEGKEAPQDKSVQQLRAETARAYTQNIEMNIEKLKTAKGLATIKKLVDSIPRKSLIEMVKLHYKKSGRRKPAPLQHLDPEKFTLSNMDIAMLLDEKNKSKT